MNRQTERICFARSLGIVLLLAMGTVRAAPDVEGIAYLGRLLFFDASLSVNRTQSCASCHDPGRAFSDGRDNGVAGAASLGDDGHSLGDRNAPAMTYASLVPEFQRNAQGDYVGGFFLDGRAATMADQAAEPFLNPLEMAMPDQRAVVDRVRENTNYMQLFEKYFGVNVFDDYETAFTSITTSIAAFEQAAEFSTFDSRYDRFLRGEYDLTTDEELGRVLFFSQLVNCSNCHLLDTREFSAQELFTNHQYKNIGIPVNFALRGRNGVGKEYRDPGLAGNPRVDDASLAGKFRVPSLRNVAVTGPYMHNGVFQDLRTAIVFYNRFTLGNSASQTNPETGEFWGSPEFEDTVDLDLLSDGQPLAVNHVTALEAFLRALTDRRYEPLLEPAE